MITQDFTKPIDLRHGATKIVLDKAQWNKAKEKEFPFHNLNKTFKTLTVLL